MPDKKKILLLHSSSDLYGASKILLITTEILIRRNIHPYIVLSEDGPLAEKLEEIGGDVIICELGIIRRKYFSPLGVLNRLKAISRASRELSLLIDLHRIDVVYSNTTGVLVGALLSRKCKTKHIWHVHEIIKTPVFLSKFIGWCLRNYSDQVIVVSNEVKDHWSLYLDAQKLKTIHNGLDYTAYIDAKPGIRNELGIDDDKILIGMIGRVNPWKGQKYFLKIAGILSKKYANVRFLMAGDAFPGYEYLHAEIKETIESENLAHLVYDLGYRTDIPYLFNGIDIFVLPSILPDPLPTVVLEAMASAKPVIATAHGGALEMVRNNITGILIPWDNPQMAADSISILIEDETLRIKMGNNGRKRVLEHFSARQYEEKISTVINNL